jgi:hypothetical protein
MQSIFNPSFGIPKIMNQRIQLACLLCRTLRPVRPSCLEGITESLQETNAGVKWAFKGLSSMASVPKYAQEQIDALLKEVADAYRKDRGQGLIKAASLGTDPMPHLTNEP